MIVGPTVSSVSVGQREARALHLAREDVLLHGRAALPAELLRPADPEPAVAAELAQRGAEPRPAAFTAARELLDERGRHQLVK